MFLKWTIVNITQKYWPTLLFTEDLIYLYLNYLAPKITLKIIEQVEYLDVNLFLEWWKITFAV